MRVLQKPFRTLGEVAKVISGYAFKSAEFGGEGIPVIKIKNIRAGSVDLNGASFVDDRFLELDSKYHVTPGDLLISLTGSHLTQPNSVVGRVARMGRNQKICLLNQRAGKVFLRDRTEADLNYLYYVLSSPYYGKKIAGLATGAANQANVSPSQVESLEIPLPDLPTQRWIAGNLSAYDNLIENNRRRIQILEEFGQSLYREWFVDFRFPESASKKLPADSLPPGWTRISIMESRYARLISENVTRFEGVKTYFATADLHGLELVGDSPNHSFAEKPSRAQKLPVANSVWFARMQETYKVLVCIPSNTKRWENAMLSSGFAGFEAVKPEYLPFVFFTINSSNFHTNKDQFCTGATQRSLTNDGLKMVTLIEPPSELVTRFGGIVSPFLGELAILQLRNDTLRRTRDLLREKLLFGQTDLEIAESAVPAAAGLLGPDHRDLQTSSPVARSISLLSITPVASPVSASARPTHASVVPNPNSPPSIKDIARSEVLCAIRKLFSDGSRRDRETALRDLAHALGYRRPGPHIREVLSTDLLTAVRRGILTGEAGEYALAFRSITELPRDTLKDRFVTAIGRPWISRDDATRAFARHLGYARTGDTIDQTARSLINGLLREGRLESDGECIRRA